MSLTFTLVGTSNILSCTYFPPIHLSSSEYGLGLIGFYTYNSIQNVHKGNNKFYVGKDGKIKILEIPPGAYEITEIESYIRKEIIANLGEYNISISANLNTFKCEIKADLLIDFTKEDSIRSLLGFSSKILEPNKVNVSDHSINIHKVTNIRVECNITSGAYNNQAEKHTIFEFAVNVEPGFKVIQEPSHVIYLPVNTKVIDNISLNIVDQDGDPVDFNNEKVVIRLELKKLV